MYRIYTPDINNMGDALNTTMLPDIFEINACRSVLGYSNMHAIGSSLNSLYVPDNPLKIIKRLPVLIPGDHFVWGTGFMSFNEGFGKLLPYKNISFCAVRGKLSKEKIERTVGKLNNTVLGDGGILADGWLESIPDKKYCVGIVPHYKEQDSPVINSLRAFYGDDSVVIDVRSDPKEVVRKIASCGAIISSSLHGLIVADSFHIPNMHVRFYQYGERAIGDGYKFADYYSNYDLEDNSVVLSKTVFPSVEEIVSSYSVPYDLIEKMKTDMLKSFPGSI